MNGFQARDDLARDGRAAHRNLALIRKSRMENRITLGVGPRRVLWPDRCCQEEAPRPDVDMPWT